MDTHYSQIPVKPLVAGMSTKSESAERIFFFERNDGQVIATKEAEAWGLWTRRPQILGNAKKISFKLIGTGDGLIFQEAVANAKIAGREDIKKAQEIIKKGQADELEACRGRIIAPRNMDEIK